jgi:hypothetical protein
MRNKYNVQLFMWHFMKLQITYFGKGMADPSAEILAVQSCVSKQFFS